MYRQSNDSSDPITHKHWLEKPVSVTGAGKATQTSTLNFSIFLIRKTGIRFKVLDKSKNLNVSKNRASIIELSSVSWGRQDQYMQEVRVLAVPHLPPHHKHPSVTQRGNVLFCPQGYTANAKTGWKQHSVQLASCIWDTDPCSREMLWTWERHKLVKTWSKSQIYEKHNN